MSARKMSTPQPAANLSKTVLARRRNAARRHERVIAAGGRQINMLLEPKPTKALARLMKWTGLPATQVISRLLVDAAAQPSESKARLTDAQIETIRRMEPQNLKPTRSLRLPRKRAK